MASRTFQLDCSACLILATQTERFRAFAKTDFPCHRTISRECGNEPEASFREGAPRRLQRLVALPAVSLILADDPPANTSLSKRCLLRGRVSRNPLVSKKSAPVAVVLLKSKT